MTRAKLLRKQSALAEGVFECERCHRIVPDSILQILDGVWRCRPKCEESWSRTDNDKMLAAAEALTDPFTPVERAPRPPCADAPTITSLSPAPIQLAIGGAAGTLTVGGVNLTSADTWSYGHVGITGVVTITSSTAVSIALSATGAVPAGNYSITFNDQVFRKAIRTR